MNSEIWTDETARTYDDDVADMSSPHLVEQAVDVLEELASAGPVVEFAVGTGRLAIPLAARGLDVAGIELSPPMLDRLRAKPGGERVRAVEGDMSTKRVSGEFSLVYLVFNTITNLLSQDAQVACFENAAAHLAPGGCFLIETFVPQLRRLPIGQRLIPFDLSEQHIGLDEYDTATQSLVSHHITTRPDGVTRSSGRFRYVWPAELDLMARIAGLQLTDRWGDWDRSPFTSASAGHVSIWRAPS